ncbi:alkaline phosphatase [Jeotgalibacillus sp. R-1-5s-1]|uniref:alkaline phosphatase n=1 Tax=Jeotgalibacillus sp. R-1-5s-1 TaxID=2555897 RepID=UPI00106AA6F6|nr:alkaline phosphatase [Jeotgalibacillus sp. R-1-5s-1]TFD98304.1 alkaline phosphatase [Jeotgalibacillus sp. R-1-5s-1]
MWKKATSITMASALLLGSAVYMNDQAEANNGKGKGAKKDQNVILLIPDGYSASQATAYRWFKGEESVMDEHLVGMMKTHSADTEVTDSAAAGTAMATGEKTNNGMISVTPDGEEIETVLEKAEANGKSTGLVATSTITHATPAVFGSHVASRNDEDSIAPQLLENDVDVLYGGGAKYFTDEMMEQAEEMGYSFAEKAADLEGVSGEEKVLGLFADDAMATSLDREGTEQPSLAEMTSSAIDVLDQNKDGFFLMVEGSQIDWAGHAHDIGWSMNDTKDFEDAVKEALEFAKKDKNTTVIIAGDHETGGMSVGDQDLYDTNLEFVRGITATGDMMAEMLNEDRSNAAEVVEEHTGLVLTEEQVAEIQSAEEDRVAITINQFVSEEALIGWTTEAHTGVDVPVYAFGPGKDEFAGLLDNTDIAKNIEEVLKLK